nr:Rep family protein [uncultured Butyrivibrio sp.]
MKSKIFEMVQQNQYLNEETIKVAILSHKIVKNYAYILHDKDVFTKHDYDEYVEKHKDEENESKRIPEWKIGDKKAEHWHVVIKLYKQYELKNIAEWFKVPANYIEIKKGRGAFLDAVEYITHEDEKQQALGKHLYDDSEIKANFDFRQELNTRLIKELSGAKNESGSIVDRWCYDILMNGKTLLECVNEDPIAYSKSITRLQKNRADYLSRLNPPRSRINIYISGQGGTGKGLALRAIARQFARTYEGFEDLEDSALFFEVGSDGATFEGYDGQPVIIWNDCRSYELFKKLGTREAIYNIFDTYPTKQKQNIKFSSVSLVNKINIINSVQTPEEFIKGLAGEYTDKNGEKHSAEDINQVRRRIVITMVLDKEYFEVQFNKGYFEDLDDYGEYYEYQKTKGSFAYARQKLSDNQYGIVEQQLTERINNKITDKFAKEEAQAIEGEDDVLPIEFSDYGNAVSEPVDALDEYGIPLLFYVPDGITSNTNNT